MWECFHLIGHLSLSTGGSSTLTRWNSEWVLGCREVMFRRHRHLTRRIVKSLCCYCCSLSGSVVHRKMFSFLNKRRKSWRELDVFTASSCSRELLFAILVSLWLSVVMWLNCVKSQVVCVNERPENRKTPTAAICHDIYHPWEFWHSCFLKVNKSEMENTHESKPRGHQAKSVYKQEYIFNSLPKLLALVV